MPEATEHNTKSTYKKQDLFYIPIPSMLKKEFRKTILFTIASKKLETNITKQIRDTDDESFRH